MVIVTNDDKDIDCPLFRQLQIFAAVEHGLTDERAHHWARTFMRKYWLNRPYLHEGIVDGPVEFSHGK